MIHSEMTHIMEAGFLEVSGQDVGQSLSGSQLVPTYFPSYLSVLPRVCPLGLRDNSLPWALISHQARGIMALTTHGSIPPEGHARPHTGPHVHTRAIQLPRMFKLMFTVILLSMLLVSWCSLDIIWMVLCLFCL